MLEAPPATKTRIRRTVALGALALAFFTAVVAIVRWLGFWNDLFGAYAFVALIRLIFSLLAYSVSVSVIADVIKHWQHRRFLRAARQFISAVFFAIWMSWLWPGILVARGAAGIRLLRLKRQITDRAVVENMSSGVTAMEVYLSSCAALLATLVVSLPGPDGLERAMAWSTMASCLALLSACVLVPDALPQRVRSGTHSPFANLTAIGASVYVALLLSNLRLDPSLQADDLSTSILRATAVVFVPGRGWILPWLLEKVDALGGTGLVDHVDAMTREAFGLHKILSESVHKDPNFLQGAQLFTAVVFAGAILGPILKPELLKRTSNDILEFAGDLIQRQHYEAASRLLNSIDHHDRNFRWAVGRAIAEIGRGDPRGTAVEFSAKAIEQYGELVGSRDPELLLYRMAVVFAVPEHCYLARLERWIALPTTADPDLWSIAIANAHNTVTSPIISEALFRTDAQRFPLTRCLLLIDHHKLLEAAGEIKTLEKNGAHKSFEALFMLYHFARLQGESLEEWARTRASEVDVVTRTLRCEHRVRIALEWIDRLHRLSLVAKLPSSPSYKAMLQSLIEQYETYPGLTNPDLLVARVSAAAFVNANVKRWPWLRGIVRTVN